MAKARTLVGLDVHATKIVAAVLDAETGELRWFRAGRRCRARRPGCAPGCRGRCARPMRPGRPGTGWRASSRGAAWSAWSRRRARSRARRATASRPIAATPSSWCGCCWPASCTRSASRAPRRRRCAISCARARRSASDLMRAGTGCPSCCCATASASTTGARGPSAIAPGWRRSSSAGRRRRRRCSTPCGAIDALVHRRDALEREIVALLPDSPWQPQVAPAALPARHRHAHRGRAVRRDRRLRALRPRRAADELPRPGPLRVTRPANSAGSGRSPRPAPAHARRLLVEAAWHYRTRPRDRQGARPSARPANPPKRSRSPGARNNACTAPGPGSKQRAKRRTIIAVAAARELAGFCWAITRIE